MYQKFSLIFVFAGLVILSGCGRNAAKYEIETVPTVVKDTQTYEPSEYFEDVHEIAMPILNAYAELERSGFTEFDRDVIGGSYGALWEWGGYEIRSRMTSEATTENLSPVRIVDGTENWQHVYAEILREYLEKPSPVDDFTDMMRFFVLYDIDKDGVPELLIFYLQAGFWQEAIYTYRDDKAVPIEGGFFIYYYRAFPTPCGSPGIILANTLRHPDAPDHLSFVRMVIDGDRLVSEISLVQKFEDVLWQDGYEIPQEPGWFINDEEVSEEEYNDAYNRIFRNREEELFPTEITEAHIQEIIFGWQPAPQTRELCYCGESYTDELRNPTPPLNIRELWEVDEDFLSQFENIHEAEYLQWESDSPTTLIIWADEPLRDFSFVAVHSNGICCAYVGQSMLTVDELQPSDAVVLTFAFSHYLFPHGGVVFNDANDVRNHMLMFQNMGQWCGGSYRVYPVNYAIDRREYWRDLEIISIPPNFSYDIGGLHDDIIFQANCSFISGEVWGAPPQMWVGYLKNESIESVVASSLTASEFIFDDGQRGYMLEFENDIWWIREDWMAMSFLHGGYRRFFEIHEDLILQIARTLRAGNF